MLKRWWPKSESVKLAEPAGDAPARSRVPATPPERTPEDDRLLDKIAHGVVRYGMTVPAIFLLESSKPLSFVGGQFLHFLSPMVHSVVNADEFDRLARLLERRDTMEELLVRIEREDQKDSGPPKKSSERRSDVG